MKKNIFIILSFCLLPLFYSGISAAQTTNFPNDIRIGDDLTVVGDITNNGIIYGDTLKTATSGGVVTVDDSISVTGTLSSSGTIGGANATLTGRLTASSADVDTLYRGTGGQVILNDSMTVNNVFTTLKDVNVGGITYADTLDTPTAFGAMYLPDSLNVTGVLNVPTIKTVATGTQVTVDDSLDVTGALAVTGTITATSIATPTSGGVLSIPDSVNVTGVLTVPTIKTATAGTQLALSDSVDISGALAVTGTISGLARVHTSMDADSTLTTANFPSGSFISVRSVASKRTYTLPAAAVGLVYEFNIVDTDSCIVKSATGDSLRDGTSTLMNASTMNGSAKFIAVDGTYWDVISKAGTWVDF